MDCRWSTLLVLVVMFYRQFGHLQFFEVTERKYGHEVLKQIAKFLTIHSCQANKTIIEYDDKSTCCYILLEGYLEVYPDRVNQEKDQKHYCYCFVDLDHLNEVFGKFGAYRHFIVGH